MKRTEYFVMLKTTVILAIHWYHKISEATDKVFHKLKVL